MALQKHSCPVNFGLKEPAITFLDLLPNPSSSSFNQDDVLSSLLTGGDYAAVLAVDPETRALELSNEQFLTRLDRNCSDLLAAKKHRLHHELVRLSTAFSSVFSTHAVQLQREKMSSLDRHFASILDNLDSILLQLKTPFAGDHILIPPESQRQEQTLLTLIECIIKELDVKDETLESIAFLKHGGLDEKIAHLERMLHNVPMEVAKLSENIEILEKERREISHSLE